VEENPGRPEEEEKEVGEMTWEKRNERLRLRKRSKSPLGTRTRGRCGWLKAINWCEPIAHANAGPPTLWLNIMIDSTADIAGTRFSNGQIRPKVKKHLLLPHPGAKIAENAVIKLNFIRIY
jgi:hypothetical protein